MYCSLSSSSLAAHKDFPYKEVYEYQYLLNEVWNISGLLLHNGWQISEIAFFVTPNQLITITVRPLDLLSARKKSYHERANVLY